MSNVQQWITNNKYVVKGAVDNLKYQLKSCGEALDHCKTILDNTDDYTEEKIKICKKYLPMGKHYKKIYARLTKFYIYIYNSDYDNSLLYCKKIQESMTDCLEFIAETQPEGDMLQVADEFKERHETVKNYMDEFTVCKEIDEIVFN